MKITENKSWQPFSNEDSWCLQCPSFATQTYNHINEPYLSIRTSYRDGVGLF